MIPYTFPSTFAANGQQQMVVYSLPSITGLTAWIDYIPVKGVTTESATLANTYANGGYQIVNSLASLTGKQAWLDYIPVYEDPSYSKPWSTDAGGYIPTSALAALLLDFTSGRLDPRITFSRTTNATLTNSAGLIANAPMNLLTFSEQFDNAAWVKTGSTVSANMTVAPNGTATADNMIASASNTAKSVAQAGLPSTIGTFTVYAKAAGETVISLWLVGATVGASFTLTGSGSTALLGATSSEITAVGNGWYRCAVFYGAATTTAHIYLRTGSSFIGDGTSGAFLWGAQLELGSTATTYNPTTVKNLLGFTENFDNAAWTKSNAFVQTNLLSNSEDFSAAAWTKTDVTVTANNNAAPDGTLTADLLYPTTSGLNRWISHLFSATLGVAYTVSVYAKASGLNWFYVLKADGSAGGAWFNLQTGAVGTVAAGVTATITPAANGFYRITVTATAPASSTLYLPYFGVSSTDNSLSVTASGTNGVLLWGAQLVQGTSAGDYKATYAAAAAVGYTDIYGQPFAQKLVENTAAAASHQVAGSFTFLVGTTYTVSIYAKAAERSWLLVVPDAVNQGAAWFDLATGAVGDQQTGVIAATIQSVGNGWYRCSVTGTATAAVATPNFRVVTANGVTSYTGDGTSGIYIFGAQLSDSASVDPYVYQPVAAPTSTAYYGPRFDYDPVTLAPKGLLIEEQRTNLLTYSEQFDNAAWTKDAVTITANAVIAPDGTLTADKLIQTATTAFHSASQNKTGLATSSHTLSFYAKPAELQYLYVITNNNTNGLESGTMINLATGVITSPSLFNATSTPIGNGWYRYTFTGLSSGSYSVKFYVNQTSTQSSELGNGTSGIFVWGAQLEAGAFATSYIPTVASQVTRAADSASMIGNNFARWYNQTEGTFYLEQARVGPSATILYATDNSANNVSLQVFANASTEAKIAGIFAGAVQYDTNTGTIAQNTFYKLASAYKVNDVAASLNGAAVVTDATVLIPAVTTLHIGSQPVNNTSVTRQQYFKRIAYYNRRLSNTELQGITS